MNEVWVVGASSFWLVKIAKNPKIIITLGFVIFCDEKPGSY